MATQARRASTVSFDFDPDPPPVDTPRILIGIALVIVAIGGLVGAGVLNSPRAAVASFSVALIAATAASIVLTKD